MDITRGEKILYSINIRSIFNIYSDLEEEAEIVIKAYSIEEILIEKITALMGRTIPRDLYDFHYLTEVAGIALDDVYIEFGIKAQHKGHDPKEILEKVRPKESTFMRDWDQSLTKQMRKGDLPEFKQVWRRSNAQFKRLAGLMEV